MWNHVPAEYLPEHDSGKCRDEHIKAGKTEAQRKQNMKKWESFLKITTVAGGIVVLCMTAIVLADVFMRYVFNKPIAGAAEYCAILMAWVAYISIGYALSVGAHMQMTAFFDKYSEKHKHIATIVYCAIGGLSFGIVSVLTFRTAWASFLSKEQMASSRVVYHYPGKFAVPIGSLIFVITAILLIIEHAKSLHDMKAAIADGTPADQSTEAAITRTDDNA